MRVSVVSVSGCASAFAVSVCVVVVDSSRTVGKVRSVFASLSWSVYTTPLCQSTPLPLTPRPPATLDPCAVPWPLPSTLGHWIAERVLVALLGWVCSAPHRLAPRAGSTRRPRLPIVSNNTVR
eukprot:m.895765 g.895765  ORF g.895765 m.895765 type:complete len:123 (-) comp60001_c0_seq1:7443-7811(-)